MRFFMLAGAVLASLAVAGCQTASIDQAIQENLPKICSGAASIHSAFTIVAATGSVSASLVQRERTAWAALEAICADPSSVNSSTALVTAAEAYAAMIEAMRQAEAAS